MTDGVNLQKHQTNVLEVKNLKKIYGPRTVVKDVSLSIKSGEVVGLLGPNGAGKTTTFYMIVGLVVANGGQILLNGESIQHLPIYKRARIGITYLPQENSVFRTLTVEENIQAILELQTNEDGSPFTKKQIKEELEKLLNELQITGIRKNLAPTVSGGERRRTEIARALAARPRFILLDEPFAGVDPIAVIEIQRIVHFLKERGIGVLITDHNVRETLGICDHAYIISNGSVLAQGKPEAIVENPQVRNAYLGDNFTM
ncbi:LPS export ABC transporter ATP-binding protein [Parasutterella sp.]|uniref:LPS export ABC transporter ATP-binding protein n=1 Tax=Parasutterella sp. TaxID=2049037 RepID=UPI0035224257